MTVAEQSAANEPADPTTSPDAVPGTWVRACAIADLAIGRGAGVLGPDFEQAALFRIPAVETDREAVVGRTRLYAVGNIDPFSRAAVLSRGVAGDRGGEPTVASPLGKQVFSLRTGICLDDESMSVPSYAVRVVDDIVEVYFQRR
ncbi:nitrite reductase small subunit NirD [Gordonia sp. LSe1-13]|uniref:Nitrite reductase small subunit NirD n=1 Tax=Gordonia sesuvii TaxID=3116777 RepID=A0ABU7MDD9_9ACTN|nr:nitrite reductase small subunit NirD [Gordonia sp. LSe1-13]